MKPPDFQVVPLRGLPIVAAVLVALIAAIAANKLWALEFFHVAAGGLWTSFDLFLGFVLGTVGKGVLKKSFVNSVKAIEDRNSGEAPA